MADKMTFPDTWDEYEELYAITDKENIYSNGVKFIPCFRVRQWLDLHEKELLDKIRAEIEKRIYEATLLEQKDGDVFYAGRNDGLQTAIDIIDKYR